jgi:hypothetical protein
MSAVDEHVCACIPITSALRFIASLALASCISAQHEHAWVSKHEREYCQRVRIQCYSSAVHSLRQHIHTHHSVQSVEVQEGLYKYLVSTVILKQPVPK